MFNSAILRNWALSTCHLNGKTNALMISRPILVISFDLWLKIPLQSGCWPMPSCQRWWTYAMSPFLKRMREKKKNKNIDCILHLASILTNRYIFDMSIDVFWKVNACALSSSWLNFEWLLCFTDEVLNYRLQMEFNLVCTIYTIYKYLCSVSWR